LGAQYYGFILKKGGKLFSPCLFLSQKVGTALAGSFNRLIMTPFLNFIGIT
jgi:hypothetical protein